MNPFLQRKPKRQRTGAVQDLAEARNHVALACVLECGSPLPLSDERFMESFNRQDWTRTGAMNRKGAAASAPASWSATTESSKSPLWVGVAVSAARFAILSAATAKAVTPQTPSPQSKTWRLIRRFMERWKYSGVFQAVEEVIDLFTWRHLGHALHG